MFCTAYLSCLQINLCMFSIAMLCTTWVQLNLNMGFQCVKILPLETAFKVFGLFKPIITVRSTALQSLVCVRAGVQQPAAGVSTHYRHLHMNHVKNTRVISSNTVHDRDRHPVSRVLLLLLLVTFDCFKLTVHYRHRLD